ncbi:MAG: hypothetical protein H6709_20485 [Kofleriaceae bacterium]|nr:hypothetical protein [Kofleriaceae bacterium]
MRCSNLLIALGSVVAVASAPDQAFAGRHHGGGSSRASHSDHRASSSSARSSSRGTARPAASSRGAARSRPPQAPSPGPRAQVRDHRGAPDVGPSRPGGHAGGGHAGGGHGYYYGGHWYGWPYYGYGYGYPYDPYYYGGAYVGGAYLAAPATVAPTAPPPPARRALGLGVFVGGNGTRDHGAVESAGDLGVALRWRGRGAELELELGKRTTDADRVDRHGGVNLYLPLGDVTRAHPYLVLGGGVGGTEWPTGTTAALAYGSLGGGLEVPLSPQVSIGGDVRGTVRRFVDDAGLQARDDEAALEGRLAVTLFF